MSYTLEALRGVKGFVIAEENGEPLDGVQLRIKGRESREFNTTKHGEYWRILLDGNYTLLVNTAYTITIIFLIYTSMWVIECVDIIMTQVSSDGYETQEVPFRVEGDEATVVNVTLRPRLERNVNVDGPDPFAANLTHFSNDETTSFFSTPPESQNSRIVVNYVASSAPSFFYVGYLLIFFSLCLIL